MKIATEKIFILSKQEEVAIETFLSYLKRNQLPCDKCSAISNGKCEGYSIFDQIPRVGESCKQVQLWFESGASERGAVSYLTDEDLKTVIQNRYNYNCAESISSQYDIITALAKTQVDKENLTKIKVDRSLQPEEIDGQRVYFVVGADKDE